MMINVDNSSMMINVDMMMNKDQTMKLMVKTRAATAGEGLLSRDRFRDDIRSRRLPIHSSSSSMVLVLVVLQILVVLLLSVAHCSSSITGRSSSSTSSSFISVSFDVEPRDAIVSKGQPVRFDCRVTSNASPTVHWIKDGVRIKDDSRRYKLSNDSLYIDAVEHTEAHRPDEGTYQCVVSVKSQGMVVSRRATLHIDTSFPTAPRWLFVEQPRSSSVHLGDVVMLPCRLRPSSPMTSSTEITWTFNDNPIGRNISVQSSSRGGGSGPTKDHFIVHRSGGGEEVQGGGEGSALFVGGAGVLESVIEIVNFSAPHVGSYKCWAQTNGGRRQPGESPVAAEITLNTQPSTAAAGLGVEPRFVTRPRDQQVLAGSTVLLYCAANGRDRNGARPVIGWLKEGTTINVDEESRFSIEGEGSLRIDDVQEHDAGSYTCRATNLEESADAEVMLKVLVVPRFVVHPRSIAARTDSDVELECKVYARPRAQVSWLKNGEEVIASDYFQIIDGHNLRILGLVWSDEGLYQCFAQNELGVIHSAAHLIVLPHIPGVEDLQSTEASFDEKDFEGVSSAHSSFPLAPASLRTAPAAISLAPVNLRTSYIEETLVTLIWKPPPSDDVINRTTILGYVVYWKEEGSQRERVLNTTATEVSIQQLKPATSYAFRVAAYGPDGKKGEEAELTVTTPAETIVPAAPTNLTALILSPTSIFLAWSPPSLPHSTSAESKITGRATPNKPSRTSSADSESTTAGRLQVPPPVVNYKLFYYATLEDSSAETGVTLTDTYYTLIGLNKFTEYSLRVVAYNKNGPGATSDEIIARTYSDVPSAAPNNFTVEPISSTSIAVSWDPPPENAHNGIITGYKIQYKQQRKDKHINTRTTDGSGRNLDLTDLDKGTEYSVRIQALTVNGSGPASMWLTAETYLHDLDESTVPGKPTSLRVRSFINSILVSWTPPVEQDIMIRGYVLGYGIGFPDTYSQVVEARQRYHTIKSLRPSSEYVISLKAFNARGEGIPIYETTVTREETTPEPITPLMPPVGLKALVLSPTTIVLSWSDTTLGRNQRIPDNRYYTVRYNPRVIRRYKMINVSDFNVHLDDLKPDTEYEFSVKVTKGARQSTWSLSTFNRTMEAAPSTSPRDVTPISVGDHTSVTLNWQPPRQSNGLVTGYLIYYTTESSLRDVDWIVDGVMGDRLSVTIRGLRAETTYYFKVQAKNDKGFGPMSGTVIFRTPRADGTGGGLIETPDDYGRAMFDRTVTTSHTDKHDILHRESDTGYRSGSEVSGNSNVSQVISTIPPLYLWIGIGCISGVLLVIVIIIVVVCCLCRVRRNEELKNRKRKDSLTSLRSKSSGVPKELKPPDLWIHGNMELCGGGSGSGGGGSGAEERDSDMETTTSTIGRRNPRSPRELNPSGHADDWYRNASMRPLPVALPLNSPPLTSISDHFTDDNVPYSCSSNQRFNFSTSPRVNISDITNTNNTVRSMKPIRSSGSSFKLPTLSAPRISSPMPLLSSSRSTETSALSSRTDIRPVLSRGTSNSELTEDLANLEGLMKDLHAISEEQQHTH